MKNQPTQTSGFQQAEYLHRLERTTYRSYLLRVWFEDVQTAAEQGTGAWQAEVKQIQSGESWTFRTRQDLLAFVRQLTDDTRREGSHGA